MLGYGQNATAVPACPTPVTVQQPDGQAIQIRMKGDEFLHWHEDADGFTILRDQTSRRWVYAEKDAAGKLVPGPAVVGRDNPRSRGLSKRILPERAVQRGTTLRSTRQSSSGTASLQLSAPSTAAAAPAQIIRTGTMKNLVVLVEFPDKPHTYTRPEFDALFNTIGYSVSGATGSVRDYYREVSYNALDITSVVTDWIMLDHGYAYYGGNDPYGDEDLRPQEMVEEALAKLEARGFDFSTVDANGDGQVDNLTVIHAGGGEEYGGNDSNYIWSHQWNLASSVTYDGKRLYDYHTEPERRGHDNDPSTQGISRIGVICHETGHSLGLPDLYDYGYDSKGCGYFCLMASGNWNGDHGSQPAQMSAWCKKNLGWVTTTTVTTGTCYAPRVEDSPTVYQLNGTFPSTQYFLVENRQGTRFDASLPGSTRGLLIWHVDETRNGNDDQTRYKVDLEEASGTQDLELNASYGDDADYFRAGTLSAFTNSTTPNTQSYERTGLGLQISGISASTGTMTFSVTYAPPLITTGSVLQTGTICLAYTGTLTAIDGAAPYTWGVAAGSLPAGLALSSSGIITGTPATVQTATFTLQVRDSRALSGTQCFSLAIVAPPDPVVTTTGLVTGITGSSYSQILTAIAGIPPYVWSVGAGSLPDGLILSGSGIITGTPTTIQTATFTVQARDSRAVSATKVLFIEVIAPPVPVIITPTRLTAGTVGKAYSQILTATSGVPPYFWSVVDGALPDGLALTGSGILAGTPATPGTATFTVQAMGDNGESSAKIFTLTIAEDSYTWTTFAGLPGSSGSTDGTGTAAKFNTPYDTAVDSAGNVYVTDSGNHTIRKITPAGVVTTLAGTPGVSGSDDGTGGAAKFKTPGGLTVDGAGNVYVADSGNHIIRKITPAGEVTTLAGTPGVPGGADGTGTAARFRSPQDVTVDSGGTLYVTDRGNNCIRKVTAEGVVTMFAGSPVRSGNVNATGTAAAFAGPSGIAMDGTGNLLVADYIGRVIRKITPAAEVTTLAGKPLTEGSVDGTGTAARFGVLLGLAADQQGNAYVTDMSNHTVRKITPEGVVTTLGGRAGIAGSATGVGSNALFATPLGIAVGSNGILYVTNLGSWISRGTTKETVPPTIYSSTLPAGTVGLAYNRTLSAGGSVAPYVWSVVAGSLPAGLTLSGDGVISGTPLEAGTSNFTVQATSAKNVCSARVVSIKIVENAYSWTNFAGQPDDAGTADGAGAAARFNWPIGAAADASGTLYVTDSSNNTIRKITKDGVVTTLAGSPGTYGTNDGTGAAARFDSPRGVAVDGSGTLYVADYNNHTIRKITPAGVVTTLAGSPGTSGTADGTGTSAKFYNPYGVAVDGSENVYVTDYNNHTIRKITPAGAVTTLAGSPGTSGTADGTGASAKFYNPCGVAVDEVGAAYVVNGDHTIRKITPAGVVTTIGGQPNQAGASDGVGGEALFRCPAGIAVDGSGTVFVVDSGNHRLSKSSPTPAITLSSGPNHGVTIQLQADLYGDPGITGTASFSVCYQAGTVIFLTAPAEDGHGLVFDRWSGDTDHLDSAAAATATLTVPDHAVSLTALYKTPTPTLSSCLVNTGSAQRSLLTGMSLGFSQPVTLASGAVTLTRRALGSDPAQAQTVTITPSADRKSFTLSFPGATGGSLPDGVYDLVISPGKVTGDDSQALAGETRTITFHRLFGDYDGNKTVNNADYFRFKNAFGTAASDPAYLPQFDYDGNGTVNNADYFQFKKRFGTSLTY